MQKHLSLIASSEGPLLLPVEYLETIEFHWKFEEGRDGIKIKR